MQVIADELLLGALKQLGKACVAGRNDKLRVEQKEAQRRLIKDGAIALLGDPQLL